MADVIFIDAKKSLGPKAIKQFKENQHDDTNVVMYIEAFQVYFERPLKDLRGFFEDEEIEKYVCDDNCVISFITDDKVLQILGLDFNWWIAVVRNKKYRRLEKLFGEVVEKQEKSEIVVEKKSTKQLIKCACANSNDSALFDIDLFEGTQKEAVAFVNKSYQMRQLRSMFKANVVFIIDYTDENDLSDMSKWHTMEELIEKGVLVQ